MLANLIAFLSDQLNTRSIPWDKKNVLKKHDSRDGVYINSGRTNYLYVIQVETCKSDGGVQLCFTVFYILKPGFVSSCPPFPCSDHTVQSLLFSHSGTKFLETTYCSHCSPLEALQGILLFPEVLCCNLFAIDLLGYCQCCSKQQTIMSRVMQA